MNWDITGNRQKMGFGLRHGSLRWWGTGSNDLTVSIGNYAQFKDEMKKCECAWSVYPLRDSPENGISERIQQASAKTLAGLEKNHAFIHYSSNANGLASIEAHIFVLDITLLHINKIFELVMMSPDLLEYKFSLDFNGFGGANTPSSQEFFAGKPYFCKEIDLIVGKSPPSREG
jgi:hypothetical protein